MKVSSSTASPVLIWSTQSRPICCMMLMGMPWVGWEFMTA
jgi:hypothetical protein